MAAMYALLCIMLVSAEAILPGLDVDVDLGLQLKSPDQELNQDQELDQALDQLVDQQVRNDKDQDQEQDQVDQALDRLVDQQVKNDKGQEQDQDDSNVHELGRIVDAKEELLDSLKDLLKESLSYQKESLIIQKSTGDILAGLKNLPEEICKCQGQDYANETIVDKPTKNKNYIDKLIAEKKELDKKYEDEARKVMDLEGRLYNCEQGSKENLEKVLQVQERLLAERNRSEALALKVLDLTNRLALGERENAECLTKLVKLEETLNETQARIKDKSRDGKGVKGHKDDDDFEILSSEEDDDDIRVKPGRLVKENCPLKEKHQEEVHSEMEKYNKTKDWTSLRKLLEGILDHDTPAYKQLIGIVYGEAYPMYWIGFRSNTALAKILVLCGQIPDIADKNGNTLLHGAAYVGDVYFAKWLVTHGASTETRDYLGWTPLMREASAGHIDLIKYLISAGADTTARAKDGKSAMDIAKAYGKTEIARLLAQLPH